MQTLQYWKDLSLGSISVYFSICCADTWATQMISYSFSGKNARYFNTLFSVASWHLSSRLSAGLVGQNVREGHHYNSKEREHTLNVHIWLIMANLITVHPENVMQPLKE